jgi:hypothetical protein
VFGMLTLMYVDFCEVCCKCTDPELKSVSLKTKGNYSNYIELFWKVYKSCFGTCGHGKHCHQISIMIDLFIRH